MMDSFDLVVRGGTVVTATERMRCDVGIASGQIVALAARLDPGRAEIDATDRLVLPGGVDSHCHIEQISSSGLMSADDFYTGTVSAAFGGTTTIVPFAAQHRGQSLTAVVRDYRDRGDRKAVIDYGCHLIVSDPTPQVLSEELPGLIEDGYPSFKVYMIYARLRLDDRQILEVLEVARRERALTMVHAENDDMIQWLTGRLLDGGHRAPKFHAVGHAAIAESEATARVIRLADLLDAPLLVVHVSTAEGLGAIRDAQTRGLAVYGETCPQYLFLTAADLDREGLRGAMWCCSPPPRAAAAQDALWRGLANGTLQVFSSDHAPSRFDASGKLAAGPDPAFTGIASGVPGIEMRMPLLFSEGVRADRLDLHRFVELTATRPAKLYGLFPRKGTIAVGSDADLALWDPDRETTIAAARLHDNVGYTPYEGRTVTGWPVTVLSRGRVVVDAGELRVAKGSGQFIPRARFDAARPPRALTTARLARGFGAEGIP